MGSIKIKLSKRRDYFMKIILDAMGGDNAPDATIKGAIRAIKEIESEIILVGNENIINQPIVNILYFFIL